MHAHERGEKKDVFELKRNLNRLKFWCPEGLGQTVHVDRQEYGSLQWWEEGKKLRKAVIPGWLETVYECIEAG